MSVHHPFSLHPLLRLAHNRYGLTVSRPARGSPSARQGPLHGLDAAGSAADDDAEVAARLRQRLLIDVTGCGGGLDVAHLPGASMERVGEEALRALAALALLG